MNEVKLILRLAKKVRTPRQALILFIGAGLFIVVIYLIPHDLLE